ncbi:acetyl-CoA carboxylase biotin carboxylase subunit family protein [Mesorhizobium sp. M0028]|uniref:ATP-grasp domain-containing protein n=1 Tax=Mesorhizobium sp. M0028 TaxID=2956849 RepID=UPI00333DA623
MTRKAFILVEGNQRGNGLRYVQAAKRLALHPITLSADPAQYDYLAADRSEAIRVDTNDLDALIRECSQLSATYDIVGISGFARVDESVYATVGKLCRHFNVPGPDPASVERCADKFTQRQVLAAVGVPMPAYRLATNTTDAQTSAAEIGLPVIVKPAVGSGSCGVRLCCNVDELADHTTYLLSGKHKWRGSPRILVEEFAQGPYYIAHMMGNEIIGIEAGDSGPLPHFVFRESSFPAHLTQDEHKRIADISLSCLRALGLGWGPACIEFRWTKRGPIVIETNPRLAGAPSPQLIQLAYGVDLIAEHVKLAIGEECNLRRLQSQTAAARFLLADRDGILDCVNGDGQAAAVSGVAEVKLYVEPKTPIVRKGDYRDWIGHVIAASPSLARTEAILQHAVNLIDLSVTPF